jgi:osmotically inducible lipoprotein OsmB
VEVDMKRLAILLVPVLLLGAAGCSNLSNREQRTLSGGAIGAGGGALVGAVTGGSPLVGALIGGAGGAAIGALSGHDRK